MIRQLALLYFFIIFFIACEPEDFQAIDYNICHFDNIVETLDSISSNEVLERAYQMATIEWTPINLVPMPGGGFYELNHTYTGIPYSSVKEINTYLFQDVSYHTFMTAVHDPKSVFYTENISEPPYHGLNCAPYYGGVCSSTVMYALGINIPYYANQIIDLPFMHQLEHQEVDSLKICDVIWMPGHVQMVYDIELREDTLYRISMFESSGLSAHISNYSANCFKQLWSSNNYVAYRRENITYTSRPDYFEDFEPIVYNDDLCPSKGDRAVYRTDETIYINIYNSNYQEIVLLKNDRVIVDDIYDGTSYQFLNLEPGIYTCYLQTSEMRSKSVSFEIIRTDVHVNYINGNLKIRFNSNALADYVALCRITGESKYYPISDQNRLLGYIVVPHWNEKEYYCKVIFKGEYGTITNSQIRIR